MHELMIELQRYLHDVLGVTLTCRPWDKSRSLQYFLQDRYSFFTARLTGAECLFMADNADEEQSPATIRKHMDQLAGHWNGPAVYVRGRITSFNRRRLIEQKVPFIVPGNQMYLPMLGVDLREHFRKLRQEVDGLSPAAQAVVIHWLMCGQDHINPGEFCARLGYSAMTLSRCLNELESAGLGRSSVQGRCRRMLIDGTRRQVWQKALAFLRSPVRTTYTLARPSGKAPGIMAGLTALSHYTMLGEPAGVTVAISRQEWKKLSQGRKLVETTPDDPHAMIVEVWSYPPALFAAEGKVDRLSLYLALRNTGDERVQSELQRMLEEYPW